MHVYFAKGKVYILVNKKMCVWRFGEWGTSHLFIPSKLTLHSDKDKLLLVLPREHKLKEGGMVASRTGYEKLRKS